MQLHRLIAAALLVCGLAFAAIVGSAQRAAAAPHSAPPALHAYCNTIDGDASRAMLNGVTLRATAHNGALFPAGTQPGAFISLPDSESDTVNLRTYLGGQMQEEASDGATLLRGTQALAREDFGDDWNPTLPHSFVYFKAHKAFDAVEISLGASGMHAKREQAYKIYGLCSDGGVGS